MTEQRTPQRLRAHYEVEKALADQLRHASPAERRRLYTTAYDALYRLIPDHPQLIRRAARPERDRAALREFRRLQGFLKPGCVFLEIGAGDCALALRVAAVVKYVYALDVSAEIAGNIVYRAAQPANFRLVLSDGCSIPVPRGSVDVAYSNQLMEHLHPDDAAAQLRNIYEALAPGGVYLCLTPNRLSGPHDISRYFDPVATGFHLKEYTYTELSAQFRRAGFRQVGVWLSLGSRGLLLPVWGFGLLERFLSALPAAQRRAVAGLRPVGWLLGLRLAGIK